ncbi:YceI family protein [bacterium]|jgi:polyisoprenoid-binding protein YceI|nr:YceI family protein [bacterium]MBP9091956.1 YceI family protein [bacterium]MBP9810339.1 YceI family protein [bacterium]
MKTKISNTIVMLGLLTGLNSAFSQSAQAAEPVWKINPEASSMNFKLKNMGQPVDGKFGKLSGDVTYDGKNLEQATVKAKVDTASIDTKNEKRDDHLRTKDFFDATTFPVAEFNSSKIEVDKGGNFKILGTLNLHGVSQPVTLAAGPLKESVDGAGKKHLLANATTEVERKKYSIGGLAAATISNEVAINLVIDLVQQ